MEYRFGEWQFNPEHLVLYRDDCNRDELTKLFRALDVRRKCNIVDKLLHESLCLENIRAGVWNPIGICPTYSCDLRCNYCGYSSEAKKTMPVEMRTVEVFLADVIKRYIVSRHLKRINTPLTLFISGGGEPTYEWDLLKDIVSYFNRLCVMHGITGHINLTTNGLLNDTQLEFLANNVQEVMVSYDGLPYIQNNNRPSANGKPTSSIVENTIRRLSNAKLKLTVRSTLWPDTYEEMQHIYINLCSLISNMDNFTWSVNPVAYEGRAMEHKGCMFRRDFVPYYLNFVTYIVKRYGNI